MHRLAGACSCLLAALLSPGATAAVISEIHYHPRAGEEGLEFLEVANDTSTPEDLSGYLFTAGIEFTFPAGTILPPHGSVAVCADAGAVKARYGIENALGGYSGKLDGSGERVTLANQAGIPISSVRYQTGGKWPVAPDGTGHSLVLRRIHLDPGEPESWAQSPELGGSPGRANFPEDAPLFQQEVMIDMGETWRYAKGTQPFSTPENAWREAAFDDSGWLEGPTGFGFADNDDGTILDDMLNLYTTVACRKKLALTAEDLSGPGILLLGVNYDDGFAAYLNGVEVARANAGAAGTDPVWSSFASQRREAGKEDLFPLPLSALRPGDNVVAVLGLNFRSNDNDFSLIPRVLRRVPVDAGAEERPPLAFNELFRGPTAGSGWLELFNAGAAAADLSGHVVTDDPERADPFTIPAGSTIGPRGFLVIHEAPSGLRLSRETVQLFLLAPDGYALAASTFDRSGPSDTPGGYSECRVPDGGQEVRVTASATPGAPNEGERLSDLVINEIFYHPPDERRGEFLELHNRGTGAIDLSGFRFEKGIDYTFADGVSLEPGGFLVIAEDTVIIRESYGVDALGPYVGRLSDEGENIRLVDRAGNLVCEVRYGDGGRWPDWADGGGSSLELIDPSQDITLPAAWDASDETGKAEWEQQSFAVADHAPTPASELHLYLVERGVCRVDDVSISRDEGPNLIPNPGFEVDTRPWVIQGTHIRSHRITDDSHSGAACLEIAASGKGDTLVNRIETDTQPVMTRGPYHISLWTRWQRGGSLLVAHGEYSPGSYGGRPSPAINLSGNTLSAALRLKVPLNLGTPGAENSARRELREATGSDNLGPLIAEARHHPATPPPNFPVPVTARVVDSGDVAEVKLLHAIGSAAGEMRAVEMLDDGAHGDGAARDGVYGGEIPGSPLRTKVVFYIEARDAAGAVRRFPVTAPEKTCLYAVQDETNERLDTVRVLLDTARASELQSRQLHSNDLADAAMVFDDSEVYYNVGVRYRGSPWGRPARTSFRVRFRDDERFHRGRRAINLSARGLNANEGAAYLLVGRIGVPEKPAPTPDYFYVRTSFNGGAFSTQGIIQPVDSDFLEKWYGESGNGPVLKVEGRRQLNDASDLAGMWDGGSYYYKTEDRENYRGYFIPGIGRGADDWTSFIGLCRVMDRKQTPDATFDQEIEKVLDLEEFLRVLSVRILTTDWDAFGVGNGHNGVLLPDPRDGRWDLLPFDVDNTFSTSVPNLFPSSDPDVARLLGRPKVKRLYFRILEEYLAGYWSPAAATPYFTAVQAATGVQTGFIRTHLTSSSNAVRNAIKAGTSAAFRIVTNAGQDVSTDLAAIEIEGDAPVKVDSILYRRNDGPERILEPEWTALTRWKAPFDLPEPWNALELTGVDRLGNPVAQTSITVYSYAFPGTLLRGDADEDRTLRITDAIRVLRHLIGGEPVRCLDAADFNDDGRVDLTDAVNLLEYLFRGGAGPPPPYPHPGLDPTEDGLDCGG